MGSLEQIQKNLLSCEQITIGQSDGSTLTQFLEKIDTPFEDCTVMTYTGDAQVDHFAISVRQRGNTLVFSIDARNDVPFSAENAVNIPFGPLEIDAITANFHDCLWWMMPAFVDSFADLPKQTQSAFVKAGEKHLHLLPLTGDNFRCEMDGDGLHLISGMPSLTALRGDFLAVTAADDPFDAVEMCYADAKALGAIRVPLRNEREMPAFARGFGWCTWDSFKTTVTSELIYEKLREFKAKNIPLKWMIIDDGWLQFREQKLTSFAPDPVKFPEGFDGCIRRIKEEFGIEKVGVWHTFTGGYWSGVDPESPLFAEQRENLFLSPAGIWLPSLDEEKAFRFWDAWHTRLKAWGVDFLKVDNQSSASTYLAGSIPTAEGCRIQHRAFERSIAKNFGGNLINCMGMDMENVLARPSSGLSRNSDDFFPERQRGFVKHLVQNVYNALWHGQLYHCDFDMWWSSHESALQSGVLRAISGSPIYVSDKIGGSDPAYILPTVTDDGRVMLCDGPVMPTRDCVYIDCREGERLQKVWNRSGENFALAAFNLMEEELTGTVDFGGIPGLGDGEYMAYEYFSHTFTRVNRETKLPVTMPADGVAVYSLYPVKRDAEGEFILMGDRTKYVPIAGELKIERI